MSNTKDEQWMEMYNLAKKYYEDNANLKINKNYEINNLKLGIWISHQRQAYKHNKLSKERIRMLNSINMIWDSFEYQWTFYYNLAKEYFEEKGNLLILYDYKINDINLGKWIQTQRNTYKNNKLFKDKIELLELLDMVWDVKEVQWLEMYNLAKEYFILNGHLRISDKYETKDGIKLGAWIANQRKNYRNKTNLLFTQQRINLLEEIGMVWNPYEVQWQEMYQLAKEYYDKNEHLKISYNYETNNGIKLGIWINRQRALYKNNLLSNNRIKLLNEINIVWNNLFDDDELSANLRL